MTCAAASAVSVAERSHGNTLLHHALKPETYVCFGMELGDHPCYYKTSNMQAISCHGQLAKSCLFSNSNHFFDHLLF